MAESGFCHLTFKIVVGMKFRFSKITSYLTLFILFPLASSFAFPQRVAKLQEDAEKAFIWGDYLRAKEDYRELISIWAGPELLLKSRQRLALSLEMLNQRQEAIRAYQLLLLLLHPPQADEAKRSLAKLYLEERNYPAALAWLFSCQEKGANVQFQMGYSFTKLGEWRKGIKHLETLTPDFLLWDWVLYLLGKCYLGLKKPATALDLLSHIPRASLLHWNSQRMLVKAYSQQGSYRQAVKIAEDWGDNANSLFQVGKIYESLGETSKALSYYWRVVKSFPRDSLTWKAIEKIKKLQGEKLSPEERFQMGKAYFQRREWKNALSQFGGYLKSAPQGKRAEEATFLQANCLFKLGDYARAKSLYLSLISGFPHSTLSPKFRFNAAMCDWKLGKIEDAFWRFRDCSLRYPRTADGERALFLAGGILEGSGDYEGAANQYLMAQNRYPQGKLADQALWRAALCLYQGRDELRSLSLLNRFRGLYPQSPFCRTAIYWISKIYQRMGKVSQAKKALRELARKYPHSYYGLKAKSLLKGRDEFLPLRKTSAGPLVRTQRFEERLKERMNFSSWMKVNLPRGEILSLERNSHYQEGRMLARLGLTREAKREFVRAEKAAWGKPPALTLLLGYYVRHGWNLRGHKVASWIEDWAKGKRVEDLPPYLLRWLYPVHLLADAWERSRRVNLDPLFVLALIRRESRFDPYATSKSGARGLMQIMPLTGEEVAQSLGRHIISSQELYRKDINLDLGIYYLTQQLYRFSGRPEMALAAYNGGPTNVFRWKKGLKEPLDIDLFVERIDYSQTRAYLKMVLKDYVRYKEIWGEK